MFHVIFTLFDGFSMISLNGALEPLRVANLVRPDSFSWRFVSPDGQPASASNDIPVSVSGPFVKLEKADLVVLCASYEPDAAISRAVLAEIRRLARDGIMLCGIESAPLILAAAGVLENHRATCHWECLPALREDYVAVDVRESHVEIDRNRMTCAGGASVIDMMLDWIAQKQGRALSAAVADKLIHSRYVESPPDARVPAKTRYQINDPRLLAVLEAMEDHAEDPLRVSDLAEIGGLSVRQLERLFRKEMGARPAQLYVRLRLERAERLLTYSHMSIRDVALATGFSSLAQFSRSFRLQYGTPPSQHRKSSIQN